MTLRGIQRGIQRQWLTVTINDNQLVNVGLLNTPRKKQNVF